MTKEQYVWNAFFMSLFLLLLGLGGVWFGRTEGFPSTIPVFDFLLLAFAVFRLIRLFAYDKITQFIRDFFSIWESGPFKTISDLMGCPWCLGIWASLGLVFLYYAAAFGWYIILVLAVAGCASFFQVLSNMIGWRAEVMKKSVLERD